MSQSNIFVLHDVQINDQFHYALRSGAFACSVKSTSLPKQVWEYSTLPNFQAFKILSAKLHNSLKMGIIHTGKCYFLESFWIVRNDFLEVLTSYNLSSVRVLPIPRLEHRGTSHRNFSLVLFTEDTFSGQLLNAEEVKFEIWNRLWPHGDRRTKRGLRFSTYPQIEEKHAECVRSHLGDLVTINLPLNSKAAQLDLVPSRHSPLCREMKISSRLKATFEEWKIQASYFPIGKPEKWNENES